MSREPIQLAQLLGMSALSVPEQEVLVEQVLEDCDAFGTGLKQLIAVHQRFQAMSKPLRGRFPHAFARANAPRQIQCTPGTTALQTENAAPAANAADAKAPATVLAVTTTAAPCTEKEPTSAAINAPTTAGAGPAVLVTTAASVRAVSPPTPAVRPAVLRSAASPPVTTPSRTKLSDPETIELHVLRRENGRLRADLDAAGRKASAEQIRQEAFFKEVGREKEASLSAAFDVSMRRMEGRVAMLQRESDENARQAQIARAELNAAKTAPRTPLQIGDAGETDVMAYLKRCVGDIFHVEHVGRTHNELDIRITDPPNNTFDIRVEVKNRENALKPEEVDTFQRNIDKVAASSPTFAAAVLFQKVRVPNAPDGTLLARFHNNHRIFEVGRWALDKLHAVIFDIVAERRSLAQMQKAVADAQSNPAGALACRASINLNHQLAQFFNIVRGAVADHQPVITSTMRDLTNRLHAAEHERPGFVGKLTITRFELETPKAGKGRPRRVQRFDAIEAAQLTNDADHAEDQLIIEHDDVPALPPPAPAPKPNPRKRTTPVTTAAPAPTNKRAKNAQRDDAKLHAANEPPAIAPAATTPITPATPSTPAPNSNSHRTPNAPVATTPN